MKTSFFGAFICTLFFLCPTSNAQNFWDTAGAISTDFQIASQGEDLVITDQFLIRRAYSQFDDFWDRSYGFGYESFHLEFITQVPLGSKKERGKKKAYTEASFFDEQGQLLLQLEWPFNKVRTFRNEENPQFYFHSINLKDIPMILLKRTKRINLTRIDRNYKHMIIAN